ncbi:chromatin modification-related protein eaf6 [Savitreella phatthalungensis]
MASVARPELASDPPVTPAKSNAADDGGSVAGEDRVSMAKRYEGAKKELKDLLDRKRQADRDLSTLESQIFRLETQYLEDTGQGGNIVRGFEGYLKGLINTRKSHVAEADRIFSGSSASHPDGGAGGSLSGGAGGGGLSGSALSHGKLAQALQRKRKGLGVGARSRATSVSSNKAGGNGTANDDDDEDDDSDDSDASTQKAATPKSTHKRARVSYAD